MGESRKTLLEHRIFTNTRENAKAVEEECVRFASAINSIFAADIEGVRFHKSKDERSLYRTT